MSEGKRSRGKDSRKPFSDRTCDKKLSTTPLIINAHPEGLIDPIPHSIIEIPSFASCTAYNFPPGASYTLLFLSLNFQFHPSSLFSYLPLFPFFLFLHIFPSVFLFTRVKSVTRAEMFFLSRFLIIPHEIIQIEI